MVDGIQRRIVITDYNGQEVTRMFGTRDQFDQIGVEAQQGSDPDHETPLMRSYGVLEGSDAELQAAIDSAEPPSRPAAGALDMRL